MSEMKNVLDIPVEARLRYLERRKKDVESLHTALKSQSLEEFKRIGHQLKGNAASFGYQSLEKIAIAMEAAAAALNFEEARKQLGLFEEWLRAVDVELR
jgi:HPt (histidine-containing phosphotransfer) domain-containing protein